MGRCSAKRRAEGRLPITPETGSGYLAKWQNNRILLTDLEPPKNQPALILKMQGWRTPPTKTIAPVHPIPQYR